MDILVVLLVVLAVLLLTAVAFVIVRGRQRSGSVLATSARPRPGTADSDRATDSGVTGTARS